MEDATLDPDDIDDAVVLKMMGWATNDRMDEVADEIHRRLPGVQRSMDTIVEFVDRESTKWHALEWVLRRYDIAPDDVLGAGDGAGRNGVQIGRHRTLADRAPDIDPCGGMAAAAVDQHQRLVRRQAAQAGRPDMGIAVRRRRRRIVERRNQRL